MRIAIKNNTPMNHRRYGWYHHFSFVIQFNKIVEWGTNAAGKDIYSHFYAETALIHSECAAFKRAKGLLDRSKPFDMVNIRLNRQDELRNSKPCKCCSAFLSLFNCNKVYFTNGNDFDFVRIS